MASPKCSTEDIKKELAKLAGSDFVCAIAYLKAELARRKGSSRNKGAKRLEDTPKRKAWREAARRYREKKDDKQSQSSYERDDYVQE